MYGTVVVDSRDDDDGGSGIDCLDWMTRMIVVVAAAAAAAAAVVVRLRS